LDFRKRAINAVEEKVRAKEKMEAGRSPLNVSMALFFRLLNKDKEQLRMLSLIAVHYPVHRGFFPFRLMEELDNFEDPVYYPSNNLLGHRDRAAVVRLLLQNRCTQPSLYSKTLRKISCSWLGREFLQCLTNATRRGRRTGWKAYFVPLVPEHYLCLVPPPLLQPESLQSIPKYIDNYAAFAQVWIDPDFCYQMVYVFSHLSNEVEDEEQVELELYNTGGIAKYKQFFSFFQFFSFSRIRKFLSNSRHISLQNGYGGY
jgi:hypothetical protein